MDQMQPVVFCADDFGISPGVNRAILELARLQRISAVSCMVNYPDWAQAASELKTFSSDLDVGLHVQLNSVKEIRNSRKYIRRQIEKFNSTFMRWPDFIDGHQHVHQLPGVRKEILLAIKKAPKKIYTRQTSMPKRGFWWMQPKNVAINILGQRYFEMAVRNKIEVNDQFLGVYDFRVKTAQEMLARFKATAQLIRGKHPIWMVHPGIVDDVLKRRDSLLRPRELEFEVLKSQVWADFLLQRKIKVSRFSAMSLTGFLQFF
jgi:predicted glycoside hydrolase/deacetylase ChbG (UPF0249 family)